MGMYTDVSLTCKLKSDTPEPILELLNMMLHRSFTNTTVSTVEVLDTADSYELFSTDRWRYMLYGQKLENGWLLINEASIKNYDQEWEKFYKFIEKFVDEFDGAEIGTHQYEQWANPAPIIFENGTIRLDLSNVQHDNDNQLGWW